MTNAALLRVFTDEAAYFGDRPVFEIVAARARDGRLAGATVLSARLGFGRSAHLHTRHILDDDQSLVIEIVDEMEKVRAFADSLQDLPEIGLITVENVEVLRPRTPGGTTP